MSVWKKAGKAHQKIHRERHQPEERQHLGLLEKKKDYVQRARDFNEKRDTLKVLKKRALNKNPDEFYHHMINSKIESGRHFEKETEDEDTPDQLKLMRTQDLKYITTKRTQELRKIEKLQAQLHLSSVDHQVQNQHKYFGKHVSRDELEKRQLERLSEKELPEIDVRMLAAASGNKKGVYNELMKRINREKELSIVQQKFEMARHLETKKSVLPPKKLKRGSKDSPPVYVWKYERKK